MAENENRLLINYIKTQNTNKYESKCVNSVCAGNRSVLMYHPSYKLTEIQSKAIKISKFNKMFAMINPHSVIKNVLVFCKNSILC